MQQRYYDPLIPRFLSVDPVTVGSAGGNFNRYWDADDNPYRFADPDGRQSASTPLKSCHDDNSCLSEEQFDGKMREEPAKALNLIGSPLGMLADLAVGNYKSATINFAFTVLPELKLGKALPTAYSVAFETTIARTATGDRTAHKVLANRALNDAVANDRSFADIMSNLGVNPVGGAGTPSGFQWHHAVDRPGVMQLVPMAQHTPGSAYQGVLHPGGSGGYAQWGRGW